MPPSKAAISKALKDEARKLYHGPDRDQLTVKNVRAHAERALELEEGLLKSAEWKAWSKGIIEAEAERLDAEQAQSNEASSDEKLSPSAKSTGRRKAGSKEIASKKKDAGARAAPAKKRKTSASEAESANEESEVEPPATKRTKTAHESSRGATKEAEEAEDTDGDSAGPDAHRGHSVPNDDDDAANHSDASSVMSIVLDGPASKPKTKRSRATKDKKPTSSKRTKSKPTTKPCAAATQPLSEDAQTIKTLQSQLVSCGIRKIWQFELRAHGDDARAKIAHLRRLLADAGMTGRYSRARADEIRERRELLADLEAVKEGEAQWGREDGDEEDEDGDEDGRAPYGRAVVKGKRASGRRGLGEGVENEPDSDGGADDGKAMSGKERAAEKRRRVLGELDFLGDQSDSD